MISNMNISFDNLSFGKLNIFHFDAYTTNTPFSTNNSGTGIVFTNKDSKQYGLMVLLANANRIFYREINNSYSPWRYLNYTSS